MRKLASIRKVSNIRPIMGKDFIEQVNVDGWNIIVKKDEFKDGDLCVYVEIDSLMPKKKEFEFLENKKYIIKTMKMSGVRSEGIVFPLSILPKRVKPVLGLDVTKILGITQYNVEVEEKKNLYEKMFSKMMRYAWFRKVFKKKIARKKITSTFPSWIRKTDEDRIQNKPYLLNEDMVWTATEKVDGCSATYGLRKVGETYEFVVCSRNNQLYGTDNVWYQVAINYDMEKQLIRIFEAIAATSTLVIQGEIIAPKVQGNKYKVEEPHFYVFNLIKDGVVLSMSQSHWFKFIELPCVPTVHSSISLQGKTVDEILTMATYKSNLNPAILAEGLVFRSYNQDGHCVSSFKAVSPEFLMKNKE